MESAFATSCNFIVFSVQLFAFLKWPHLFLICANLKCSLTTSVWEKAFLPPLLQAAFCPGDRDDAHWSLKRWLLFHCRVHLNIRILTCGLNLLSLCTETCLSGSCCLWVHWKGEPETGTSLLNGEHSPIRSCCSVHPLVNFTGLKQLYVNVSSCEPVVLGLSPWGVLW